MRKHNRIAIYVSNRALTAFNAFRFVWTSETTYNDIMRPFYDALYRLNAEADFIDPSTSDLSPYKLIVVPALYAASDAEIARLNAFARDGGHVFYTFKSGFSDENVKVRYAAQPGGIAAAAGVRYSQFTIPQNVSLEGDPFGVGESDNTVRWWMELLEPAGASVVARYHHPQWGSYAAMTRNAFGKGEVTYLGFMPGDALAERIMADELKRAGLWGAAQAAHFPAIIRSGELRDGRQVHYLFNYSAAPVQVPYGFAGGADLLTGKAVKPATGFELPGWGAAIVTEDKSGG